MSDATILSVLDDVVDRLYATLHRTNSGPCVAVKVLGGELAKLVEGEVVPGFPALWLFPRSSNEEVIGVSVEGTLLKVDLGFSIYVAVSSLYGEEARLVGKGNDIGAAELVDRVRTRLLGWAPTGGRNLKPNGFDLVLEALTEEIPVSVYEYRWRTAFETRSVLDETGLSEIEDVNYGIYLPDEEEPILEGVTELEEDT